MLRAGAERRAQAEDRVRGDATAWQHRGDERQLVRGAGDVAIREPRAREAVRLQEPPRLRRADGLRDRVQRDAKRLEMFPFDDGEVRLKPDATRLGEVRLKPDATGLREVRL